MNVLLLALEPDTLTETQIERVRAIAPNLRVVVSREREEIEELLGEIEVVAGQFPRDLLPKAPRLRWFQQWGAGSDWLLQHPEAVTADFLLTNASGVHSIPISEHILAFMFAFARALPRAVRDQVEKNWNAPDGSGVFELADKTMLLIGVGEIGARTARLASALGMRVVGVRHDPSKGAEGVSEMHGTDHLPKLLPHADFVVLTVPLTRETQGMIGEAELHAMKESAYLVNIGRGGTVDEVALVAALQEGWIAGAGLDVFEEEPLPVDSRLWAMENVIVTSHYSGSTPHYDERAFEILLDNLERYQAGEPLRNVVDKRRGY
ncbi:MAG: D-2-hydroxyacid dehydrogenase [Trueperaceae bacterium]